MFTEIRTLLADHHHELRMTGLGLTAIGRESPGIRLSVSRRARSHARMNGNLPLPTTKFRRKSQCIQRVISKCGGDRRGVSKYGFRGPSGAIRAPGRHAADQAADQAAWARRVRLRAWRRWRRGRRAAAPGPAADGLQGSPEADVGGEVGVGGEARWGGRPARTRAPASGPNSTPSQPMRSTVPPSWTRSMMSRIRPPSRTRPIGPPAIALGPR